MSNHVSKRVQLLTPELIENIKDNPCIAGYSDSRIRWTKKFLDEYCEEFQSGKTAAQILREHGIDPLLLGDHRIATLRNYYCHKWRPAQPPDALTQRDIEQHAIITPNRFSRLEHNVKYLTQEVEALKKISLVDSRAGRLVRQKQKSSQSSTN